MERNRRCFSVFFIVFLISLKALVITAAPIVTLVEPYYGSSLGGNQVTLFGSGFSTATSVSFGGTSVTPRVISDSQLEVTAPAHVPQVVFLTVTAEGQTSPQTPDTQYVYQGNWLQANCAVGITPAPINFITATTNPEITRTVAIATSELTNMVFTPDGTKLYCLSYPDTSAPLIIIDVASGNVVAEIAFGAGASPSGVVFDPAGKKAYVTDFNLGNIYVLDTSDYSYSTVSIGGIPYQSALSPDGGQLAVSNTSVSTISIIDTKTLVVSAVTISGGFNSSSLLYSPNGSTLYVIVYDGSNNGSLYIVDAATLSVQSITALPTGYYGSATLSLTPSGDYMFIATTDHSYVIALPTKDPGAFTSIDLPVSFPSPNIDASLITPDGQRLYLLYTNIYNSSGAFATLSIPNLAVEGVTELLGGYYLTSAAVTADSAQIYIPPYETAGGNSFGAVFVIDNSDPQGPYRTVATNAGTTSLINAITPDQAPLARFTATQGLGGEVLFNAGESLSPVGSVVSYEWDFGDGSATQVTATPVVSHRYSKAASYAVSLKVTNSAGTSTRQTYNNSSYWNGYVLFNPSLLSNGGASAHLQKAVEVAPAIITSLSSDGGKCGQTKKIQIMGNNFLGTTAVFFGDKPAVSFKVLSNFEIEAKAPKGCQEVAVVVETALGRSEPFLSYSYRPKKPRDVAGISIWEIKGKERANLITWEPPFALSKPKKCCRIASYRIYGDADLTQLIGEVDATTFRFVDREVVAGNTYTYYIVSVDRSGTQSNPVKVKINPLDLL